MSVRKFTLAALLLSTALSYTPIAVAGDATLTGLPYLPGAINLDASASVVNGDGSIIAGDSTDSSGNYQIVEWINGVISTLQALPGGTNYNPVAISNDGTIIAGAGSDASSNSHALIWVNGVVQDLGYLSGHMFDDAQAYGMSHDGSVVVGYSNDSLDDAQAVEWIHGNIHGLGFLAGGGQQSIAQGVSDNGSIVIGSATDTSGNFHAVKWINGGAAQALGDFSGYNNTGASGISGNGSVIIGYAGVGNNGPALKWVNGGAAQSLGLLPGGGVSSDASSINIDGSVIAGWSTDASNNNQAVVWLNGSTTIQKLSDVLTAKGLDLTGWTLNLVNGMNETGNILVGNALVNGVSTAYIANLDTSAITTPQNLATSLQGNQAASQQISQMSIGNLAQSMFAAQHLGALSVSSTMAPQVRHPSASVMTKNPNGSQTLTMNDDDSSYGLMAPYEPSLASRLSVFTVGSLGLGQDNNFDNHEVNGIIGASIHLDHDVTVGVGYLGASSHNDMVFGGKNDLDARGATALVSYMPEYGLRAFGTAYIADMDLTIDRNYMNGAGIAGSRGTPDGNAHGVAAEVGYAYKINQTMKGVPFLNTNWSRTSVDAYSETGGPFDADFSTQHDNYVASELGYELDYQAMQKTSLYGRLGLNHRFSGEGNGFTASAAGVTETLGSDPGDRNWVQGTVGVNYQATDKIRLSTELSGRTSNTETPETTLTAGANISF